MAPHGRLGCVLFLTILTISFPAQSLAQEQPAVPHQLSQEVQLRARELKVWELVAADFKVSPASFPVFFPGGRGWQPLQVYIDQLAAADVMATARAKRRGAGPQPEDYDIIFASWCTLIPNKPPATAALREITTIVRTRVLVGSYLSGAKRAGLTEAMRPVLLTGSKTELLKVLGEITTIDNYDKNVLNTRPFR